MNPKRPQPHTPSTGFGVVPSDEFAEEAQPTTVWDEDEGAADSAARPVAAGMSVGGEVDEGDGEDDEETRAVLHVSDDFEEELPTVARTDSSAEVPLSGEVDAELADIAQRVSGHALPPPSPTAEAEGARLTFSNDFEEELPTVARVDPTPPPVSTEHTEMLADGEVDALSLPESPTQARNVQDRAGLIGHDFGGFRVVRKIAEGGMASVYLGRKSGPRGFAQHAALKVVHPHFAHERAFVDMFLDEARIAALINHPSVCRVLDFGQARGTYFLAMEYVHGESWADVVTAMLGDDEARDDVAAVAAYVVAQACEGLFAAHSATDDAGRELQIVHRDISPQNIFVAYDGTVRVLDFGIAHAADRLTNTRTGTVKGRLAYMAPEQMRAEQVDQRADIWSLGVILREALEGRRLFRRRSEAESMLAVVNEPLPDWDPSVPPALRAIADRALSRNREDRFGDCREMGRALTHYLAQQASALSPAEVSNWVTTLFAERMAQKRQWLHQPVPEPSSRPSTLPPPIGWGRRAGTPTDIHFEPDGLAEQLEPDGPAGSPSHAPLGRYSPTLRMPPVQPPRSRGQGWLWAVLAACVLALLAVGGVFLWRTPRGHAVLRSIGLQPVSAPVAPLPAAPPPAAPLAVAADTPGVLVVQYENGWAEVLVDGEPVGKTPLHHELEPGRVIVELRPFGRTPGMKHPMKFAPGQTQKLKLRAAPKE